MTVTGNALMASLDDTGVLANGMTEAEADAYRACGAWTGDTHQALLARAVARFGDAPAASDQHRSLTWNELDAQVNKAAATLSRHGIGRGDGVIVQLPNSVAYLETVFAIWRLGAIPVFALAAHGCDEVAHFARTAPARHHIGPARPNRHMSRVLTGLAEVMPEVVQLAVDVDAPDPWSRAPQENPLLPDVQSHELSFLQLSGGTTGVPKLIPRTHDDYLYSVRASIDVCDLQEGDVLAVVLPASHNFTMSSPGILGAVQVGASIVFVPDPSPSTVRRMVARHQVTHMALVPPLLLGLLNAERPAEGLESLRTLWVGGAKLSATAASRVRPELGCALQQVFGMAEGLVNYTKLDDPAEVVATTQGTPMSPYDEIRVGDQGQLQTRGPYTIRRYHRNPEANATSFTSDGFYVTGDLVEIDANGNITVVGRAKDQINRGGEKVAPEVVENSLLRHRAVHDVSVVGDPDEVLGEKVRALVILREPGTYDGPAPTPSALRKFVRESGAASFAVPDVVNIVSEFPLTGVGKVSKRDQRG